MFLKNKGININIQDVETFKSDTNINNKLRKGDSIGCFYIESPGMRQLLAKLDCKDYLTLVAASSIIRPGVSQSGMMEQYIFRHHNRDKFTYIHPKMEELLKETYGIMIYQEDVIKVGHEFGGLDKGKCDKLRKGMSGKSRGINPFIELHPEYLKNCKERGYSDEVTNEVWRQMQSFSGYSFSKAHSASFAVESYQSLYLKTYFPMEFMVAVMNNDGGFYPKEVYYRELVKTGAKMCAPCVNNSDVLTNIKDTTVHLGLYLVKTLQSDFINAIIEERNKNGLYKDLIDFIERLAPDMEQLNILIRIDAFRFTRKNKKELLWEANFLQKKNKKTLHAPKLFKEKPFEFSLPQLSQHYLDDAIDEVELIRFPLCNPFELVDADPKQFITADELHKHIGKTVTVLAYLVVIKESRTRHNEDMIFGTFYDYKMQWLDTIHWPAILKQYPLTSKGFYKITGKVTSNYGVNSIEVTECTKLGIKTKGQKENDLFAEIKDFKESGEPQYQRVA